jgi:hypothetical protein
MSASQIVLALALLGASLGAFSAADQVSKLDAAASAAEATRAARNAASTDPNEELRLALPSVPTSVVLSDPVTRQAYLKSMQRYYEYRSTGYDYRGRVFEWQLTSGKVIFAVVLMVVLAGLVFAAIQFYVSMIIARARLHATDVKRRKKDAAEDEAVEPISADTDGIETLSTKLQISGSGVAVESSVLGVIILTLSLVFFYLYLVFVYPVTNVF